MFVGSITKYVDLVWTPLSVSEGLFYLYLHLLDVAKKSDISMIFSILVGRIINPLKTLMGSLIFLYGDRE